MPAWNPGGAAYVTVLQSPQASPGRRTSVTVRRISMSMTCAHRGSAASAPSKEARQDRHSVGGSAVFRSFGSGSRSGPFPRWPGWPPRLRFLSRSRSDSCRSFFSLALRAAFAPMPSFEDGVPESELSMLRRRSRVSAVPCLSRQPGGRQRPAARERGRAVPGRRRERPVGPP
jgi:hypothetical protein